MDNVLLNIVIFTRDRASFTTPEQGYGESRAWVLNPDRHPDRVIIYYRDPVQRPPHNEVWLADFVDVMESSEVGRHVVRCCGATRVRTTGENWREFAETWTHPIRYIGGD